MLFSIIIPVYNTEQYIAKCLKSCILQSYKNIEIIIIDDCGNDKAMQIAYDYKKQDDRIKIFHNPHNYGLFRTRIIGEKQAKGDFIMHLDSDDFLEIHACRTIFNILEQGYHDIDFIRFNVKNYPTNAPLHYPLKNKIYTNQLEIMTNLLLKQSVPAWSIWRQVYSKKLIGKTLKEIEDFLDYLPKINMGEDILRFLFFLKHAQRGVDISEILYNYTYNPNSISRENDCKAFEKQIADLIFIANFIKKIKLDPIDKNLHNVQKKIIMLIQYNIDTLKIKQNPRTYFIQYLKTLFYRPMYWKTYIRLIINLLGFGIIKI